jgi:hypothetical protein
MAIVHLNKQVANTVTLLTTLITSTKYTAVSIQNNDSASIFVGDATVSVSGANKGHVVAAGATYQVWIYGGDALYAISSAGTSANAVSILYSQVA